MHVATTRSGDLPQHAPKSLPLGVLALDGWADRLIALSNCAWLVLAGWQAISVRGSVQTRTPTFGRAMERRMEAS